MDSTAKTLDNEKKEVELKPVEEKKKEEVEEDIGDFGGIWRIYREFGGEYWMVLITAYIVTFLNGCVFPFFGIVFREILATLTKGVTDTSYNIEKGALRNLVYFICVGIAALVFTIAQYYFWGYFGSKVGAKIRQCYFETLLKQEVGYIELSTSGNINHKLSTECLAIQEGISTKMGFGAQQISSFIFGSILAFFFSWRMALVLVACTPVLAFVGMIQGKMFAGAAGKNADPYLKAGGFSQEVLTNVRIVIAYPSLVLHKLSQYGELLDKSLPGAKRRSFILGGGLGLFVLGLFGFNYSVGLYYGSTLVDKQLLTVGDMFGCFFSYMVAGMALGQIGSVAGDIAKAKLAGNKLFWLMQREPKIRGPSNNVTPINSKQKLSGKIEFRHVEFAYPSAPKTNVLGDVSFKVEPGKSLAIVGPSGSGKSTVVALLERFYDPNRGEVYIDDQPIQNYDIEYLRSQIGLVSQMPLLFDTSIKENIRGGRSHATDDDIIAAAKLAFAHDFIMQLPKQYETRVGELGGHLSGGQRQRIAIARAMLGHPPILLLDEATSALDSKSENEVQMALDNITSTSKHTIIVVAHRLSTIQKSDNIAVLVDGDVEEQGTHQELIAKNGIYSLLVKSQQLINESKADL